MPKLTPTVPVQVHVSPAPLTNSAVAVWPGFRQVIVARANDAAKREVMRARYNILRKEFWKQIGDEDEICFDDENGISKSLVDTLKDNLTWELKDSLYHLSSLSLFLSLSLSFSKENKTLRTPNHAKDPMRHLNSESSSFRDVFPASTSSLDA